MVPSWFRLASPFEPRLQNHIRRLATKANATVLPRNLNEQISISKMAQSGKKAFGTSPIPPVNMASLKLQSAEMVNHNTKRLRFEFADSEATSGLALTQATLALAFPNGGWIPAPRPYTPVSSPTQKGFIEYLVKLYPNGKGSGTLHSLQPGQSMRFMPIPVGMYRHNAEKHNQVAMIAGGAGITPMYTFARSLLADPADRTKITLIWGVNETRDLFLKDEFLQMEKDHPDRFRSVFAISKTDGGEEVPEGYKKGYITPEMLKEAGVQKVDGLKVLVCGPPPFESALLKGKEGGVLGALGFKKADIHQF
ncbi:hypothetical protein PpBr36_01953 [Pyricularia pennisetigena]|uniref:hypothetical protein n=1 Tax=Pyricularia pennisetigena TaxID=1578925 RepID=UPI001150BC0A|nr:hypothetical protein PpBr36_01953 [Pyricularia pennisetigena]TLS28927.1 hypothetical protein PpBr36_01953 [Pyricularia pennisetigena]